MTHDDLAARYGRTPARTARLRFVAIAAAAGVAAVVIAWVVWVGLLGPSASLETKDVGYVATSDDAGEVRWQLTAPADTPVSCALKAVSEKHAVVGWLVVEVPPSIAVTPTPAALSASASAHAVSHKAASRPTMTIRACRALMPLRSRSPNRRAPCRDASASPRPRRRSAP